MFLRRLFDMLISGIGLLVLSPLLLAVSLGILVFDGWPVFYVGTRVGRHGRLFGLCKFRTMVNAKTPPVQQAMGSSVTVHDDPRVTSLGKVLRGSKLDELPQLFNVLAGQMSLVGPRPEDPEYVALYTEEQRRILDFKPGITGVAALTYVDEAQFLKGDDWETVYRTQLVPAKVALEIEYAAHRTIYSDLKLLARTVFTLGRRAAGGGNRDGE